MKKIILTSILLCFYAERTAATEIPPFSSQSFQDTKMPLVPVGNTEMSDIDDLSLSFSQLEVTPPQEANNREFANVDSSSSQVPPLEASVPTADSDILSSSSSQLGLSDPVLPVRARSNSDSALIQSERSDSAPVQTARTGRNARFFTPVPFVGAGKRTQAQRKFSSTKKITNVERNILGLQKRGFPDKNQKAYYLRMMAINQTEGKL